MNNQLFQVLKRSGWYEGRTIKSEIEKSPLFKLYPKKIIEFYNEFGGLTLHCEECVDAIKIDTAHFYNEKTVQYYANKTYKIGEDIDFDKKGDLDYYYSTLIGTQLYSVAELTQQAFLMLDINGNFYVLTVIPELIWISNETSDALNKILFGSLNEMVFNEDTLTWIPPKGKELFFLPPVNPKLIENPW